MEESSEVTGRQGRERKQLLDDLKKMRGYWKLKEEALDYTQRRIRFGRGYGPVARLTNGWINPVYTEGRDLSFSQRYC